MQHSQPESKMLQRGQALSGLSSHSVQIFGIVAYAVKLDPHPQLFVEFGLMKLNPCRIRVSSKSSTIPARYKKLFGSTNNRIAFPPEGSPTVSTPSPNTNTRSRSRGCESNRML